MTKDDPASDTPEDLSERFCFPGLTFDRGPGGLVRATIRTDSTSGELYLHGAHLTAFQPLDHDPVLWMSKESLFESGKPIRGGIPVCFPWFGPHATETSLPGHGLARIREWNVASVWTFAEGGIGLQLRTVMDSFTLSFHVHFGRRLELELRVALSDEAEGPVTFEEALHTYLTVGDIREVCVTGLESAAFIDKVDGGKAKPATGQPIDFIGETDRVYAPTTDACVLADDSLKRSIMITKAGSQSTVVWNPWIAKSARMPDFGDNEWTGMVCIETANVGANAVTLEPGEIHTMAAVIAVDRM